MPRSPEVTVPQNKNEPAEPTAACAKHVAAPYLKRVFFGRALPHGVAVWGRNVHLPALLRCRA